MEHPTILVLQPSDADPPARLGEWLTDAGAELDVLRPFADPVPATAADYAGVVCLGGRMAATDDLDHPWLADVRRLLADATRSRTAVLGVCLGAQLLAVATGGRVAAGEHGPEAGPSLVAKRDAAWVDPLFADLPLMPDVLQFHGDVIDPLPPGAELLAASPRYPNQAFRIGGYGYGVQFHIETTPDLVREWARDNDRVAAALAPDALDQLDEAHEGIEQSWRPFTARFVDLAAGRLEPVGGRHGLPLV
ncbi:GMP synthase-like glutamine amidotransferase [Herbihabitans rhizosphaerae]|uniref:GMP synthase-like glutamine amidotransferase n=1 Tax=Herbihabitans rhizosphaerae TaxID=1872711 RepID=A0A4Q7KEE0_9PSEU|nr:type 1 glutamine amidotransferase [Herbihabitans rhizosphaerae]RZS32300.1 GMP synthase-like glutamine amidotransferase [Herbihabitans rhizosphaerae]